MATAMGCGALQILIAKTAIEEMEKYCSRWGEDADSWGARNHAKLCCEVLFEGWHVKIGEVHEADAQIHADLQVGFIVRRTC